jgi:hypothetical protein
MRGLKTKETSILRGHQIFHNYIRTHEGVEGKTRSEACEVKIIRKKQVTNLDTKHNQEILNLHSSITQN